MDDSSISGFWRRIFAFVIDMAVLGVAGVILGALFFDALAGLGGWGRGLGFLIALCYFGVCNSSVVNGQTIGKRLLGIRVADRDNGAISLPRSLLRFTVFGVPYFANGALYSPAVMGNSVAVLFLGVVVFFGMGSIVYLYLFNRKTRQTLHDLVCGTYVVHADRSSPLLLHPFWKGHFAVLAGLFVAVIVVITVVTPRLVNSTTFADLSAVQQALQDSGLVHDAMVTAGKSIVVTAGSGRAETTTLAVNAIVRRRPADYAQTIRSIAVIVMTAYPKAMEKDAVVVNVVYGYDIGIASSWINKGERHTPQQWNDILFHSGATPVI